MDEDGVAPSELAQRLFALREQIVAAERHHPVTAAHMTLLAQLQGLAEFIESARQEVAAVGAHDIVGRQVPAATDELDAVVLDTAEATELILDECEALEAAVRDNPLAPTVAAATARIYEACSFQDITGQRVAKVVKTLQTIEAKVGEMVRLFGPAPAMAPMADHAAMLLNGPQRGAAAMKQNDVDALLASFE